MIDLASAGSVFGTLNCQGDAAIGSEFPAGVLLPGGEAASVLVGSRFFGVFRADAFGDDERPLEVDLDWALQVHCVAAGEPPGESDEERE